MLEDYIFDDRLRYEGHRLIYTPANEQPIVLTGMLGAAVLAALLVDTPEGDARGITFDCVAKRDAFFARYEQEVLRENGGLFTTEVQSLCQNYQELTGSESVLFTICGNDRLYDLAMGLTMDYMRQLVREQVYAHIYEAVPWKMPFAQWLYDAGYVETRRRQLLSIDWSDEAAVYAFAQELEKPDTSEEIEPTFIFEGLRAGQVLQGYWEWLWEEAQKEANLYPDEQVQLAEIKKIIRDNEINYDFLKPEMKHFTPIQLNLFRKWMTQWKDLVDKQIPPEVEPEKHIRQELFLDSVLPVPEENKYAQVREYIKERSKYDANFKKFVKTRKRTVLCHQLTLMFGWVVSDNALGKSMRRKLIHPKKNLLQ